ncbi:DUF167 domain-containing protein [Paracoccaceae bacterium Fryx2]|nr:DUF167 domain-containing protein [Paracoccaceae bacterium Fryx2]
MSAAPLSHLAVTGARIAVRVTPRASRNAVVEEGGVIRVYVTCVPEDGKATRAVAELLAKAMGVAKTRLTLLHGAAARDKLFRLD